jgi:hypothetical protein
LIRRFFLLLLSVSFLTSASDQRGALDPEFAKVPFDQWLGERDQAHFHWSVNVPHAVLSFHQRFMGRVEVRLDGKDLDSRRGDGQLMYLIQITDGEGTRYQDHGSLELSKLSPDVKGANIEYSEGAFLLPGEYRLAVGILDTGTGEHSTRQVSLKVPSPHDFLLEAWRDLPPVEYIGKAESPDSWYLPDMRGRLQWAASVHSPARLNVILNVDTSEPTTGLHPTHAAPSSGLAALLPTLKAISQTGSPAISEQVELLDIARRTAVFHQENVHDLDWTRLKAALGGATTASIDVHTLSARHHDAQFFVSQVRSLLRASEKPSVLVVLSQPVGFDSGEDLDPISTEALPGCHVIYIRYHASMERVNPFDQQTRGRSRGGRMGGPMGTGTMTHNRQVEVVDQLEGTLKPLSPKVIDVETPDQMTKALAETLKALATSQASSPQ